MTSKTKPIASLSLDLDNKWSYMKTHGDAGWELFPSYLDLVVPRALKLLDELKLKTSFFIVGQDAAITANQPALRSIADAGHEIGNHSFHHEPWLHLYSIEKIEQELALAEEHIQNATGKKPVGFRGPGFSLSPDVIKVLIRRGYLYDASTLPTFIGPLARAYYFMSSRLTSSERHQRNQLFGTLKDGFRPNRPYWWSVKGEAGTGALIEIPVTTMPIFRLPIHVSYVLYLSLFSESLALNYFKTALLFCRIRGVQPSLLLHPLDFMGCDDTPDLSFFPAMNLPAQRKVSLAVKVIRLLSDQFDVRTLQNHAQAASQSSGLRVLEPSHAY
ncbi:MAG: polysaccharide deacetylase family protein [Anaerolineales bacterium]|nr:polysaccharide deacetylase family protein [Anaerolineales bacterium]